MHSALPRLGLIPSILRTTMAALEGRDEMNDFALPETRYAVNGDVNLAYQVMGDGPVDIVLVPGFISHIEFRHELPGYTASLPPLALRARGDVR